MAKSIIKDRVITSVTSSIIMLTIGGIGLYFGSFAKESEVEANTKNIVIINERISKFEEDFNKQQKNTQEMICLMAGATIEDSVKATEICNMVNKAR